MTCPRKGWWAKYYPSETGGLEAVSPQLNLEIGSAVHLGIEAILKGMKYLDWGSAEFDQELSAVIVVAQASYDEKMESFEWEDSKAEGRAQVEAMISLFAYHQKGLRALLNLFEIIYIEPEVSVELGGELIFNSRPDLIVRSKEDGLYYTIDFKTASQFDERAKLQSGQDFQSILQPTVAGLFFDLPIVGEIRWNLIKGRKQKKFEDGNFVGWESASYLIRPYVRLRMELELAWGEYWSCVEPHENGRKICNGGMRHKRVGDWQRADLWKLNGVSIREWVKEVCQVLDRDEEENPYFKDIENLIVITEPIMHSEEVRMNTLEQVVQVDKAMRIGASDFTLAPFHRKVEMLNKHFPQNRTACEYPYRCNFHTICHGKVEPLEGMLLDGQIPSNFRSRKTNHDESDGEE